MFSQFTASSLDGRFAVDLVIEEGLEHAVRIAASAHILRDQHVSLVDQCLRDVEFDRASIRRAAQEHWTGRRILEWTPHIGGKSHAVRHRHLHRARQRLCLRAGRDERREGDEGKDEPMAGHRRR